MAYKTVEIEVDVDLEDFDTEDLIEELHERDVVYRGGNVEILNRIYMAKIRRQAYDHLVDELIYAALGKIV